VEKNSWITLYKKSIGEVALNLPNLKGILVGLNVNVDAILFVTPELISQLIKKLGIDPNDLVQRIKEWKGIIETPSDFVTGLCGCFSRGKASEWIIQNKKTYDYLLQNLSLDTKLRMGGNAGIMSEILAQIDIPNVYVHAVSLSKELRELFSDKQNVKIPVLAATKQITFKHPKTAESENEDLYLHIISEFDKGDELQLTNTINWKCPRDNRFIATFDPPNSKLDLIKGFEYGIDVLANKCDGFIISGFHMLEFKDNGIEGIREKIINILDLLSQAKKANPKLVLQLELCSTKNKEILKQLIFLSKEKNIWDSLSCNERELGEILEIIGYRKLAKVIKQHCSQRDVIDGCLEVSKNLKLKRLHLHEFGCYILLADKEQFEAPENLTQALLFSALLTAFRASTGENLALKKVKEKLDDLLFDFKISNQFIQIAEYLDERYSIDKIEFMKNGRIIIDNYHLVAIPTILIDQPRITVGLGDTVSSTALAAQLALQKTDLG